MLQNITVSFRLLISVMPFFSFLWALDTEARVNTNLITYYSLNKGSGNLVSDDTGLGKGYDGTMQNGASWADGRYGQSVVLNGSNGYISIPHAENGALDPQYITVSAWINPTAVADRHRYIVSKHRDCCDLPSQGGYGLRINQTSGVLRGEIWRNSNGTLLSVDGGTPIPLNTWTHIAITFDGSNIRLYVNGTLDGVSAATIGETIQPSIKNLVIGALSYLAPTYYTFAGQIDEVRIYDRALTEQETAEIFSAVGGDPALSFYESFDNSASIDANGGLYSGLLLEPGIAGNAAAFTPGSSLSYPATTNINANKGSINFWFKPNWPGDDNNTHYLLDWFGTDAHFRVLKFYSPSNQINYFVFRIDHVDGSQRSAHSFTDEPNATMQWQAGQWHNIEIIWDFTTPQQYIGFILDGGYSKVYQSSWGLGTLPSTFSIGSTAASTNSADGFFDELKIYKESSFDPSNPIAFYQTLTERDGIWQHHETVHNSPFDAPILETTVKPNEDYLFFRSYPFEAVYEGTVPTIDSITNAFSYRVAQNEYKPLFFNIYSRQDLNTVQVSFSDFVGATGVIAKANAEIRVVKNWFQAGRGPKRTFFPVYTPELLLSDDRVLLEGQEWSHAQLPSLPVLASAITDIASFTSKQFLITVHVPAGTPPGTYTSTVTVTPTNLAAKTLTLTVDVLPFSLQAANKDYVIYHRARVEDQDLLDFTGLTRYKKQVEDIARHGFNGITLYGLDNGWQENKLQLAHDAGITGTAISMSSFNANLKGLLQQYGYEPYFYGMDEPNSLSRMIDNHIPKSIGIHAGGAKVVTAIQKQWADRLKNPNDEIYAGFPAGTYEPLDFANLSFGGSGVDYFDALINGTASSQQRETYYWQIMQENPQINRLNSGFFLWNTGLSGVFPYVYQHVINNPYDDFGTWYAPSPSYRHHLVTYPSQEGPVLTMQWESLREGINDIRYLSTWLFYKNLVNSIDPISARDSQQLIDALLTKYKQAIFMDGGEGSALPSAAQFSMDRETIRDEIVRLIDLLPPMLEAIPAQTITEAQLLSFVVTATDPDSDALTLTAQLANGDPLSMLGASFADNGNGTGQFSWTPSVGQAGTYRLDFTVTDSHGLTDIASVLINVNGSSSGGGNGGGAFNVWYALALFLIVVARWRNVDSRSINRFKHTCRCAATFITRCLIIVRKKPVTTQNAAQENPQTTLFQSRRRQILLDSHTSTLYNPH